MLKKKLEEAKKANEQAERAWDQVEQDGYNTGVAETEEALRVDVPGVCRTYCSQTWYEALNWAGFEASSSLRKATNVYYPLAIRRSVPFCLRINVEPEVAEVGKDSTTNVTSSSANLFEKANWPEATQKEKNANQGVAPDAIKPPITSQDPHVEKEASKTMEIVLASLPLPATPDLASKGLEASEVASTQPIGGPPKEKLVIKKK